MGRQPRCKACCNQVKRERYARDREYRARYIEAERRRHGFAGDPTVFPAKRLIGRKHMQEGYTLVYVGSDHPMANLRGHCREHRLVMAEALGRPLRSEEHVHHINGVKTDNRLENLHLFADASEHQTHHKALERAASRV